ncbi:integrase catalytic subunit [Pseudoalteromonas prydzensis ACAM 620]|nr:integrase catalytic subunit [Pseudoalteromonas prydzensis ACAM 620]
MSIDNRWAYLAVVIDLFSCKVVGWAMSLLSDTNLTLKALEIAYESRSRPSTQTKVVIYKLEIPPAFMVL